MPDSYPIIRLLGKGRTGGVYAAQSGDSEVAIRRFFTLSKALPLAGEDEFFLEIATKLNQLGSDRCIQISDYGIDEDGPFWVMPLLDGVNLRQLMASGRQFTERSLCVMAQRALEGLSSLHAAGLIHGALDATSLFFPAPGHQAADCKIIDPGLSQINSLFYSQGYHRAPTLDPALTAPEALEQGFVSEHSDVFALGQLIFHAAAGGHPLSGVDAATAAQAHLSQSYPKLAQLRPNLSPQFHTWVESLIQPEEDRRPHFPGEALMSLHPLLKGAEAREGAPSNLTEANEKAPPRLDPKTQSSARPVMISPAMKIQGRGTTQAVPAPLKRARGGTRLPLIVVCLATLGIIALIALVSLKPNDNGDQAEAGGSKTEAPTVSTQRDDTARN